MSVRPFFPYTEKQIRLATEEREVFAAVLFSSLYDQQSAMADRDYKDSNIGESS